MKTFIENNFHGLSPSDIKKKIMQEYKHINFENFKNCIIYGASKYATTFIKECTKNNITIDGVIDDNKGNTWFNNFVVLNSLETIKKTYSPIVVCTQRFGAVINHLDNLGYKNTIPLWALQIIKPKLFSCHQFYKDWTNELFKNRKKYSEIEKIFKDKKSIVTWRKIMLFKHTFNPRHLNSVVSYGDDYFPQDINLNLTKKEIFFDCGGWTGDTTEVFIKKFKKFKKIMIYEPSLIAIKKLKKKFNRNNIIIKKVALNNKREIGYFYDSRDTSSTVHKGVKKDFIKIVMNTIDNTKLKKENITIKMNIEGSEKKALIGAKRTIMENNTNLIICLNHKPTDIVELTKFILSLKKNYKYFLRTHDYGITQLVLYAIDKSRLSKKFK